MPGASYKLKKATEKLYDLELKRQELRKTFVKEKDSDKKAEYRKQLIDLEKEIRKAEDEFEIQMAKEPEEYGEDLMDNKIFRAGIRRMIMEAMKSFDYNSIVNAVKKYGDLEFFANYKWYSLPEDELDTLTDKNEDSLFAYDKEGDLKEVWYKYIEFIQPSASSNKRFGIEDI